LALRLLGPLEVRVHGQPVPPPRFRKTHWALALLALRAGREVDREWLAGTLWPESAAPQALYNLRRCLSELRVDLDDQASRLGTPTRRTLCLDLAGASVDLVAFEQALVPDDPAALGAAVALYRGPLLEGCLEEWVLAEREARQQQFLLALQQLARHALARGEPALAVAHLRRASVVDPLQESTQRELMEALAADGDFASAAQAYRDLRLRLHRDLNAAPDPETAALFDRIRAAARRKAEEAAPGTVLHPPSSVLRPPSSRLPQPVSRLVGRQRELREVKDRVASARLVTLTGAGGIGKTRLALQAAEELAAEYADGAGFVDLAAVVESRLVPHAVAAVLGLPEAAAGAPGAGRSPAPSPVAALVEHLALRELLLVLDNCEHLVDACAHLVEALLGSCRRLRILATSRQALGLTGEVSWRVPSLSLPGVGAVRQPDDPATLLDFDAVRLFAERAAEAQPDFSQTPENLRAAAEICAHLDGIPLAIELAAARLKALTAAQIAARLADRFRLLTGGSRTALPRQQTLRATMDWSYDLLTGPEQSVLRRLSVFAGGWTLEAAEAVCSDCAGTHGVGGGSADCGLGTADGRRQTAGDADRSAVRRPSSVVPFPNPQAAIRNEEVLDLLTSLVDRSLVLFEGPPGPGGAPGRYRLLETVREYAREQPAPSGEERGARQRHRDYFLAIAAELEQRLFDNHRLDALDALATDQDNLRAALAWSLEEEPEVGLRLVHSLDLFWRFRSGVKEGCEWVQRFLARCPALPGDLRCKAYLRLGEWTNWYGDLGAAAEWHRQALAAARAAGEATAEGFALCGLGVVSAQQGDYRQAAAFLEESAARFQGAGWDPRRNYVLTELGSVYHHLGEDERAQAVLEECLALAPRVEDHDGAARALDRLGDIAAARGDYPSARTFYTEKLAVARSWGIHELVVHALNDLGRVAWLTGDPPAAGACVEEALEVARQVGSPTLQTFCLNHLTRQAYAGEDWERLRAWGRESVELAWQAGEMHRLIPALRRLAALAVALGEPARAARLLAAADRLEETHGPVTVFEERSFRGELVALARGGMEEAAFAAAWKEGLASPLAQAVQDALRWAG
jgi:predicted ATPase/DNA-binding SARP family transcriptional activator